ncbi:MAG: flagellar hook-basal body complex protein FliE [Sphingomonadales bacterium 32-68-7]|nr:MAG: flagellar hook-basal body complex protein FliE [Sphingomonadales bacterium 12-68-11]OYX10181.1 MAG: flagellar hook-basal body complex protein FliE [Sphingomonadales bacterium 32-68-7]
MNPIGSTGAAGVRDILAMRQQIIDRSQLLQQINTPGTGQVEGGGNPGGGFADTLRTALDKVNDVQGRSEALSVGYQRGEVTDIAQVMLARQEAGLAFEATLQVRNRLLSAYQDIMRMGV